MTNLGWSRRQSPFHAGEIAMQERLGVRTRIEAQGRRFIRDYLTEQHRQFFAQLPFLIAGTVDAMGRPWASILVGEPGFLTTPDERTLQVASKPLFGDPLTETLVEGADIGLLGIELSTRRRNRMNGTITAIASSGFSIQVEQSFGNCPKYIQARTVELTGNTEDWTAPKPISSNQSLEDLERRMIAAADTFFIATAFRSDPANPVQGVDVSHRGGKPGFVQLSDNHTLTFPDFAGNLHFNTVGNLLLDPHAGLLFIDFERGDLLYLTGTAEVIWDSDQLRAFAGAERLIRFQIAEGRRVQGNLPLHWSKPDYSPFLDRTGSWEKT
ncbi:pyridoxamine 5'-phosphate oxidase family protein [Phormidium tenue FACHB-886]|nr:pyridoxamine 5'-phosphate oxidase family protein [Phormidium tenue FACHB-886]